MKLYKTKKNCGKLLLGILAFCTGMILLTGCGSSSEQKQNKNEETAEENKEEDKVQIGLTVDSFVIERWIRDRDVFVATARELGAEVNVKDAGADVKEQISQIEYFINKQVDVIVVIARDCGALSDAIQKAQSAGIPVISYDRMVNNANTDLYISFDNRVYRHSAKYQGDHNLCFQLVTCCRCNGTYFDSIYKCCKSCDTSCCHEYENLCSLYTDTCESCCCFTCTDCFQSGAQTCVSEYKICHYEDDHCESKHKWQCVVFGNITYCVNR